MAIIRCQDVSFDYEGNIVAANLNFEVNHGDYLCIVGENGSGKSTLMKGILQLKQPCKGKIHYGDGLKPTQIGYLPQQTVVQKDFPGSVFEVVLSGRLSSRGINPFYTQMDKKIARSNMDKLKIRDLEKRCYRELSGGQQQRAILARALCATQNVLLLDEPVAGLDPVASQDLYRLIEEINNNGVTIIMVSHDMQSAVKYADHILHLKNQQLFFGAKEDYAASNVGGLFMGGGQND